MASTKNVEKLNENVRLSDYRGRWLVMVFYPLDFTFVCPTELTTFSDRYDDFESIGADVIGISTDSVFSHRAWLQTPRDKGGVEGLRYPLASDQTRETSRAYGVLIENQGIALRGLFVIEAASYDEAVSIANSCPHLEFGSIEVREVEVTPRP